MESENVESERSLAIFKDIWQFWKLFLKEYLNMSGTS